MTTPDRNEASPPDDERGIRLAIHLIGIFAFLVIAPIFGFWGISTRGALIAFPGASIDWPVSIESNIYLTIASGADILGAVLIWSLSLVRATKADHHGSEIAWSVVAVGALLFGVVFGALVR